MDRDVELTNHLVDEGKRDELIEKISKSISDLADLSANEIVNELKRTCDIDYINESLLSEEIKNLIINRFI